MRCSLVLPAVALLLTTSAIAQHHPSPGTSFEQLLAMTRAAIDAHQNERAARHAMLARARILVRPNPFEKDALVHCFDDIHTPAVARAKLYVAAIGKDRKAIESLGPVSVALAKIGEGFARQAEALIARNYKECVFFAIEPLWAFDPERALALVEKAEAIADVAEDDAPSNASLQFAEAMARGASGRIQVAVGEDTATVKEIKALRKSSAPAMAEAGKTALEAHFPWVAIDLAGLAPSIFAYDGGDLGRTREAAWKALVKPRDAASKAIVSKWFATPKKTLPNTGWAVAGGAVRFPPAKAQRGLFLTSKKIEGDFSFCVDIATDFDHRQLGLAFAYKSDDDFCALFVKRFDGKPGFLMSHYVKGEPEPFGKWIESETTVVGDDLPAWPLALERHGDMLSFAIGEFSWSFVPAKDLDLTGSVGLFCDDTATCADKAEASRFELEELPAAASGDR